MHGICDYYGLGCHSITSGSPAARVTVLKRRAGSKMPCALTCAEFLQLEDWQAACERKQQEAKLAGEGVHEVDEA